MFCRVVERGRASFKLHQSPTIILLFLDHLPHLLPHLEALLEEMDTLESHLPLLFAQLDAIAPHLDAIMMHRQVLMPHIGKLLPVLPTLSSSLGEMLEPRTFAVLAPHLNTLVPALPLLAPREYRGCIYVPPLPAFLFHQLALQRSAVSCAYQRF